MPATEETYQRSQITQNRSEIDSLSYLFRDAIPVNAICVPFKEIARLIIVGCKGRQSSKGCYEMTGEIFGKDNGWRSNIINVPFLCLKGTLAVILCAD